MLKRKIVFLFIIIFFNLHLMIPLFIDDGWPDYKRLHKLYPGMTYQIYSIIYSECLDHKIDINDFCGLIQAESQWSILAVSKSGAIGLCQIMPFNYKGSKKDLFNPEINIPIGVAYFKYCLNIAKGDQATALRFYNAGPNSSLSLYKNWAYIDKIKKFSSLAKKGIDKYYIIK